MVVRASERSSVRPALEAATHEEDELLRTDFAAQEGAGNLTDA